ncbi:MAG: nuclear transport factor 2 family protein [Rhodococcus sp. (in: high G+C Gram-positive bacteria)]
MSLHDVELIRRVKYRYLRALDTKDWELYADTLTEDVITDYGAHLKFSNRDEVVTFMSSTLGPAIITEHHCSQPEVDITGEGTATGIWNLSDRVIVPSMNAVVTGSAFYHDTYRRCVDGEWRISSTGYERTWEASFSLDDMPSFTLTANMWAQS